MQYLYINTIANSLTIDKNKQGKIRFLSLTHTHALEGSHQEFPVPASETFINEWSIYIQPLWTILH
jgi:hypothetical protein